MIKERQLAVLGASGFVGEPFVSYFDFLGTPVLTPSHSEVDITKRDVILRWFEKNRPKSVVLMAAWTDVKNAEVPENRNKVSALNVDGVQNVIDGVRLVNGYLAYIDSDYVYPGDDAHMGPYSECCDSMVNSNPTRGWYAETKRLGRFNVVRSRIRHGVCTISYPFGNLVPGRDYALKMIAAARRYPVYIDQFITPTYLPDFYGKLYRLVTEEKEGIYHFSCNNLTTPYAFTKRLIEKLRLPIEIKMGQFPKEAKMPQYGGLLKCDKTERLFGESITWQKAVDEYSEYIKKNVPLADLLK